MAMAYLRGESRGVVGCEGVGVREGAARSGRSWMVAYHKHIMRSGGGETGGACCRVGGRVADVVRDGGVCSSGAPVVLCRARKRATAGVQGCKAARLRTGGRWVGEGEGEGERLGEAWMAGS